jgi:RNA polymerase sigma factor (sigma-70 family)
MDRKKEFIAIIQQHKGLIYKVAGYYTDHLQDREDLFQEIVFQLWKSFDSFNNSSGISTWMYRVAMNTAIYFLKKRKRNPVVQSIGKEALAFPQSEGDGAEEQWATLHKHINALSLLERGIVMLYLEGKSYEEIGELIGLSSSNVGTRLSRIREKLKKEISKTT